MRGPRAGSSPYSVAFWVYKGNVSGRISREGSAEQRLARALGAAWPRGRRVLQGGFWRSGDLSHGRYRRKRGCGRPALCWQRILLGFRRVTTAQELQPRIV